MNTDRRIGRLHVLTDTQIQQRHTHLELALLAAAGGADVVQLREKRDWTTAEWIQTARALQHGLADQRCRLVVDDRADVAFAAGAAGVHLGRADLPPDVARRLLGPDMLIGGTANSLEEALTVAQAPIDYLGVGPIYGTRTKANPAPDMGLETLAAIVAAVDRPVIAIGSITAERIGEVMETGAWGIALLSAVVCDPDPEAATAHCRSALDDALEARKSKGGHGGR